jgi:4-hydroxybenzoate polyprenyltransferase
MSEALSGKTRRLRFFLALSRTPHLLIDLATPFVAALLCLGRFPGPFKIVLGILTVFAGYACIYALNDVTDHQLDTKRMANVAQQGRCFDLDCLLVRHPVAQGLLSLASALTWTVLWGVIALTGAALLNPVCAAIFVIAVVLEIVYCKLYRLSHWRILLAAVVKTLGGLAAIFAVNPHPQPSFVFMFLIWVALWEVGGQNIPNDLMDMQEDGRLGGMTLPLVYGDRAAVVVVFIALVASSILGLGLVFFSPLPEKGLYLTGGILSGLFFLLLPFRRFVVAADMRMATDLFNKASLYPLGMLSTTVACLSLSYLA